MLRNHHANPPTRIPITARMCTLSPGLVGDFLRDGSLPRELRRPNPIQLCADLIESPIQIQYRHVYQVAARGVGCAGMVFLASNLIEDES